MTRKKVLVSALLSFVLFIAGLFFFGDILHRTGPDASRDPEAPAARRDAGTLAETAPHGEADPPAAEASDVPRAAAEPGEAQEHGPVVLSGKVTDSDEGGVPEATVIAVETRGWRDLLSDADRRFGRDPTAGIRHYREVYRQAAARLPRARTDADGRYAFRALVPAEYRVVVNHPEFLPERDAHVLIRAGEPATCDVELVPGNRISGRVIDANGDGVAGARVRARTSEEGAAKGFGKLMQAVIGLYDGEILLGERETRTDDEGAFALGSLEPVLQDVEVRKDGFAPRTVRKVRPGTSDVVVVVEPGVLVTGRVVSPRGDPIAGAVLELGEPGLSGRSIDPFRLAQEERDLLGEKTVRAETGEDGTFELGAAASGVLELRIQAARFPVRLLEVEVGGRPVELGRIVLAEPHAIAGVVLDAAGAGLVGAEVSAAPDEGAASPAGSTPSRRTVDRTAVSTTVEAGAFVLEGLGEGTYRVEAVHGDLGAASARDVAAGRRDVRLQLGLGQTVRGRVLDGETRLPLPEVEVLSGSGRRLAVKTDASGEFVLRGISEDLAEGTGGRLFLSIRHPDYEPAWKEVRPGDTAPVEILLSHRGGLLGTVVDSDGNPVEGARVRLEVPGAPTALLLLEGPSGAAPTAYSDRDGRFSLTAPRRAGVAFDVVAERAGKGRARVSSLAAAGDGSWPELELVIVPGARLEGRVLDPDGAPVGAARLRAVPVAEIPAELRAILSVMGTAGGGEVAYSRKDGTYEIRDLDPCPYRIEVAARGYATKTVEGVQVLDGTTRQDFVLDPGASLSGRVVDISRVPLAAVEVVAFLDVDAPRTSDGGQMRRYDRAIQDVAGLGAAQARTGDDGAYALTHLAEGRYRVVARTRGYDVAEAAGIEAGGSVPDLVLVPFARLHGRVLAAPLGAPVTAFRMEVRRSDREEARWSPVSHDRRDETFSASDGAYVLEDLPAGTYEMRVSSGSLAPSVRRVALEPGEEKGVDLVLSAGGRVTGRLLSSSGGEPIVGATISLHPERTSGMDSDPVWSSPDRVQTATGQDGAFELSCVSDGQYSLAFNHEGYCAASDTPHIRLTVPSDDPLHFDLVLDPAGRVRGTIRGLSPLGQGRYRILTLSFVEGAEAGAEPPRRSFSTIVRGDGSYSVGSLPQGTYRLEITSPQGGRGDAQPDPSPPTHLGTVETRSGEETVFDAEAGP